MPRKPLIRSSTNPYHITSRANNQEWFYIPIANVWSYSCRLIIEGEKKFEVKIDAFVLMNNHYHLLIYTPKSNIDKFMQFFNKNLSLLISRQAGRINRIFGASYKWNLINSDAYYLNVIRYIYQNPLRAGLTRENETYPYLHLSLNIVERIDRKWLLCPMPQYETNRTKKCLRSRILE